MRKTSAMKKRSEVIREKVRRVRVATLMVEGEGCRLGRPGGEAEEGGTSAEGLCCGIRREWRDDRRVAGGIVRVERERRVSREGA